MKISMQCHANGSRPFEILLFIQSVVTFATISHSLKTLFDILFAARDPRIFCSSRLAIYVYTCTHLYTFIRAGPTYHVNSSQ